ncbi:MAG: hypothetical protein FD149_2655 [Rhodospirillaceae bacterium]|nr:MAG: hypothetical protein FD149_2655 [Rhodospirillaceae bacterium]
MKKYSLSAAASAFLFLMASSPQAATINTFNLAQDPDGMLRGQFRSTVEGTFDNIWGFNLSQESNMLATSLTVSLSNVSRYIRDLTLSLFTGTYDGNTSAAPLTSTTDDTVISFGWSGFQFEGITYSGALTPGDYYLQTTGVVLEGSRTLSGNMEVAPVPLPAALPLFGIALAGLMMWNRKGRGALSKTA